MREEIVDGKTVKVFDSVEELKWHYHDLLCHSKKCSLKFVRQKNYTILMNRCKTVREANHYATFHHLENVRVKTLIEWMEDLENLPEGYIKKSQALRKYPEWVRNLAETNELPEWWICDEEVEAYWL